MLDRELIAAYGSADATGTKLSGDGLSSVSRFALGDFRITLDNPLAAGEACLLVSPSGSVAFAQVNNLSATVKQVLFFAQDGVTAADAAFNYAFLRTPNVA